MGKRAKPIGLHLVNKNPGHKTKAEIEHRLEAEASLQTGADKVLPPEWLCAEAKREFERLAELLISVKLVTNSDVDMLAAYCNAYIEYIECDRLIREEGFMIEHTNAKGETNEVPHPLFTKKKASFAIMAKVANEFGFTPASRAKIAIPKKEKKSPTEFEKKFGEL